MIELYEVQDIRLKLRKGFKPIVVAELCDTLEGKHVPALRISPGAEGTVVRARVTQVPKGYFIVVEWASHIRKIYSNVDGEIEAISLKEYIPPSDPNQLLLL